MTTYVMKVLPLLVLISCLMLPILQCRAQTSGLTITSDEYNWTNNMKRLGITTPEKGLIFNITIFNNSTTWLEADDLFISIQVSDNTQPSLYIVNQQINVGYLYLPPKESDYRFVKVTAYEGGNNLSVGSYTAKLNYFFGSTLGQGTPIEPYPFSFKVMSEGELQKEISQNPTGNTYNFYFYFPITLVSLGGITLIAWALWDRRKKKQGKK